MEQRNQPDSTSRPDQPVLDMDNSGYLSPEGEAAALADKAVAQQAEVDGIIAGAADIQRPVAGVLPDTESGDRLPPRIEETANALKDPDTDALITQAEKDAERRAYEGRLAAGLEENAAHNREYGRVAAEGAELARLRLREARERHKTATSVPGQGGAPVQESVPEMRTPEEVAGRTIVSRIDSLAITYENDEVQDHVGRIKRLKHNADQITADINKLRDKGTIGHAHAAHLKKDLLEKVRKLLH